jgi:hypothetical protein
LPTRLLATLSSCVVRSIRMSAICPNSSPNRASG